MSGWLNEAGSCAYATKHNRQVRRGDELAVRAKHASDRGLYHHRYTAEWFLVESAEDVIFPADSLKMRQKLASRAT